MCCHSGFTVPFIGYRWNKLSTILKGFPAMWETQVRDLGWEDLLEKEMTAHSSIFLPGKPRGWRSLAGYRHGVTKRWIQLSD